MASDLFGIVGTVIAGAYEVEAVVAEGGFAVVYRAHHAGFGASVALKCLKLPQKLGPERQALFLKQFREEAALLFQLSSSIQTVVRPLHIDALTAQDGTFVPYMVLEWLEGETLASVIAKRGASYPLKKLVRLLSPVANALERAHNFTGADGSAVSIVHCDLKPENIFLAKLAGEDLVKILDFGVAKAQSVASQVAGHATGERGVALFTPAYAAPEQWAPDKYGETGPWTDVWGLALTMVEAMAGRPLLVGDVGAMMGVTLDPLARPTPRNNDIDVPDAVEAVFERALALDPRDRPAHVGVFWDELLVALGMKEDRPRDARREVGAVLREERIDAPKPRLPPEIQRRPVALKVGEPNKAKAAFRAAPTEAAFDVDDPFDEHAVPQAEPARGAAETSLEAAIPSIQPGPLARPLGQRAAEVPVALTSLEASLPSLMPVGSAPGSPLELSLPSEPPGPPATPGPAAPSSLEAALPSHPPGPSLEASLSPPPQPEVAASSPPRSARTSLEASLPEFGDKPLELGDDDGIQVDIKRSELPPRPAARQDLRPIGTAVRAARPPARVAPLSLRPGRRAGVWIWVASPGLIAGAIGIALLDRALRGEDGSSGVTFGPVTLTMVAGLLLAGGVGVAIYGLLPRDR